jgi:hypothetical protein
MALKTQNKLQPLFHSVLALQTLKSVRRLELPSIEMLKGRMACLATEVLFSVAVPSPL